MQALFGLLCAVFIFCTGNIYAFDRSFFYRASSFWDEPRLEYPWLSTINMQVTGGATTRGRNAQSEKVPVFDLYGHDNFKCITIAPTDVPNLSCTNTFGCFTFCGSFDITELNINWYQNFCRGFFWHLHVPVVSVDLYVREITDLGTSSEPISFCNLHQTKEIVLKEFLARHNLSLCSVHERGFSDISFMLGWARNYQDFEECDYLDVSFQLGALFPSGKEKNLNQVFDIPLGYNGHWGIPWIIDIATGSFEWLTLGAHADGVHFFDRTQCRRMRTIEACTGLIRLETGEARVSAGSVWRLGGYGKADHFGWGFSIAMAITYEHKDADFVAPCNTKLFDIAIVNNDQQLQKWSRWIYQFVLEYDFAEHCPYLHPHAALIYNHQISGKRVFSTNMIGGYWGLNLTCDF